MAMLEEEGEVDKDLEDGEIPYEASHYMKTLDIIKNETSDSYFVPQKYFNCKFCPLTVFIENGSKQKNILDNFKKHMQEKHSMCFICEAVIDNDINAYCMNHKRNNNNKVVCNIKGCVYTSNKTIRLFFHASSVHNSITLYCNMCAGTFSTYYELTLHMNKHSTGTVLHKVNKYKDRRPNPETRGERKKLWEKKKLN